MEPRITLITLAVADLDRALAFYRDGLGWPTDGIVGEEIENGAVVFFELRNGLKLALWPRSSLANEARVDADRHGPASFEVAHNVRSKEEVDKVVALARAAGAKITNPPADRSHNSMRERSHSGRVRPLGKRVAERLAGSNPALSAG
jgi:catechol 2,3-dioxygenase-like lactoylglutathione lyase family enzyme